uniref:serine C-palmitoyltransferase n=1 Tax=Phaeomonas parva TaxID=124430 RepID=A0A7S1U5Q6_9STRA|mmetsp:Transcript_32872/g.104067  ORF Transcript_32872/g.104067 Transcript_32872/m.104067 type:complete len:505 (+) Transcript_32872:144-1658(+)
MGAGLPAQALELARSTWDAYRGWWWNTFTDEPQHVIIETFLILFIIWLTFFQSTTKPYKDTRDVSSLTKKEIDELVADWQPEPLVKAPPAPAVGADDSGDREEFVVEKVNGNQLHVAGYREPLVNFASFDFLGLGQEEEHKEEARLALLHYGCGSCGPRGFYGTFDVHMKIESEMARFFGTDEGIMYSDAASAVTSAITAFAKRGDILMVDEACHEPIWTGVRLSRAHVYRYKHNDMRDLELKLLQVQEEDKKLRRDATGHRRFIVTEGLFKNCGDVCDLPAIVRLKERFKYRLILDDTFGFGVLGDTGRGTCEHHKVPVASAEVLLASLAHSLCSVGGVCVGSTEVVDHQRLSGAGYVFSASAPPFVSSVAIKALHLLEAKPERIVRLRENIQKAQNAFAGLGACPLVNKSSADSPIQHFSLAPEAVGQRSHQEVAALLNRLQREVAGKGFATAVALYSGLKIYNAAPLPAPTLRITLNSRHTETEVTNCMRTLHRAARAMRL